MIPFTVDRCQMERSCQQFRRHHSPLLAQTVTKASRVAPAAACPIFRWLQPQRQGLKCISPISFLQISIIWRHVSHLSFQIKKFLWSLLVAYKICWCFIKGFFVIFWLPYFRNLIFNDFCSRFIAGNPISLAVTAAPGVRPEQTEVTVASESRIASLRKCPCWTSKKGYEKEGIGNWQWGFSKFARTGRWMCMVRWVDHYFSVITEAYSALTENIVAWRFYMALIMCFKLCGCYFRTKCSKCVTSTMFNISIISADLEKADIWFDLRGWN